MPTITKVYPIYTVGGLEASLINFVENKVGMNRTVQKIHNGERKNALFDY